MKTVINEIKRGKNAVRHSALHTLRKRTLRKGLGLATGVLLASLTAEAADVMFVVVLKGQSFIQTGVNEVALSQKDEEKPLNFMVFAEGEASDSVLTASVTVPPTGGSSTGQSYPLLKDDPMSSNWGFEVKKKHLYDLNAKIPDGHFTIELNTQNDGQQHIGLDLTGGSYPNPPQVTNYAALQSVTHTAPTLVQWVPMTSGTVSDFIQLEVEDAETGSLVYESPSPGQPGALNGLSVNTSIPAGTFSPGHSYVASLMFAKFVDTDGTSYPGAQGIAGYQKDTRFSIQTSSLPGSALGAQMIESIPGNYVGQVARDSVVAFRFSKSMNPAFTSVAWTGVPAAGFTYTWVDGNKTLLCKPAANFPADAQITWELDLTGFRDSAGFPLVGQKSGEFHTSDEAPASPPDADFIYLVKKRDYRQEGSTPHALESYEAGVNVDLTAFNRIKEASVTVGSFSHTLRREDDSPEIGWRGAYAATGDVNRFFPNENYELHLSTWADGEKSMTLSFGTSDDYPAVPTVTNWAALQSIDTTMPTTITWTSLAGWSDTPAVGNSMIELSITNEQGKTIYEVSNEDFTSAGQYTIPAGILWPGRSYRVGLQFSKIKAADTSSYAGVTGVAMFTSHTHFKIATAGDPALPKMSLVMLGGNINMHLTNGEPQWSYVLESSRDLLRWLPREQVEVGTNGMYFYDVDSHFLNHRFYRVRDLEDDEQVQIRLAIQGIVWTDDTHSAVVAGAVVSTNLDGQTVVTDSQGKFFLETDTPAEGYDSTPFSISIQNGTVTKTYPPQVWGSQPRGLDLEMN